MADQRKRRKKRPGPVAIEVVIERHYDPDREALKAALRVVLGLPAHPVKRNTNNTRRKES